MDINVINKTYTSMKLFQSIINKHENILNLYLLIL